MELHNPKAVGASKGPLERTALWWCTTKETMDMGGLSREGGFSGAGVAPRGAFSILSGRSDGLWGLKGGMAATSRAVIWWDGSYIANSLSRGKSRGRDRHNVMMETSPRQLKRSGTPPTPRPELV